MKDKHDLNMAAVRIAQIVGEQINKTVPASVSDMPYARQYVLEQVTRILEGAI